MNSRGASLVELLFTVTLLAALGAALSPLIAHTQLVILQTQRAIMAGRDRLAVRSLLTQAIVPSSVADLQLSAPDELEFDRFIGQAVACSVGSGSLAVDRRMWGGLREPDPDRDEVLLLSDDGTNWVRRVISAVESSTCPSGNPSLRIQVTNLPPGISRVRVIERSRLRRYRSGGEWWLGLERASDGGPIAPFAGPVADGMFELGLAGGLLGIRLHRPAGAGGSTYLIAASR